MGLTLIQAGNAQDGVKDLKDAYEAATGNDSALTFYAAGLYYAGQTSAADALLVGRFGTTVVDDVQLMQAYTNLRLYDRLIAVWKMRVNGSPNDVQKHLGLASVYFAACRLPDVYAELAAIAKIQPAAAAEMQNLRKQIETGAIKCGK